MGQSDVGKKLLQNAGRDANDLSSLLLADEEGFWTESTAALRVGAKLNSPAVANAASALQFIPKPLRDVGYRVVADNRYSFLGKISNTETPRCKIGKDAQILRERFLDEA